MRQTNNSSGGIKLIHWFIVGTLIVGITILHYSTMTGKLYFHTLYRDLYFIPILLMSFWYGLRIGLYTALIIIVLYLPHVFMTWSGQPGVNFGNLMQVLVFVIVAATMGYVSDRERKRQAQIAESRHWAAMGRASLAMSSELDNILRTLRNISSSSPEGEGIQGGLQQVIDKLATLEQASSRFAPDRPTEGPEVLELNEIALRARNDLFELAKSKGVNLALNLEPAGCYIRASEANMVWVAEELLKNAIDHSKEGDTVTLLSKRRDDRCVLGIKDEGKGIPAENLQKIFVPFFTTKEKGTGLGLAACQKIMRDEGASIEVESSPGQGSTFTMAIPQAHTNVDAAT